MSAADEFLDEDLAPYLLQRKTSPPSPDAQGGEAARGGREAGAAPADRPAGARRRSPVPSGGAAAARPSAAAEPAAASGSPGQRPAAAGAPARAPAAHNIDTLFVSDTGKAFVVGWADDGEDALRGIGISLGSGKLAVLAGQLSRCRRRDVETALGFEGRRDFGFFGFFGGGAEFKPRGEAHCFVQFASGAAAQHQLRAKVVSDEALLEIALGYLAGVEVHGSPTAERFRLLESQLGTSLVRHWRELSRAIAAGAVCDRFGAPGRKLRASIVVCLYGRAEYFFLQSALFSRARDLSDHEFIYVSNSPELAESLDKEARIAQRLYGLNQALVTLPGNAGFGGANNVAASFANSDRLVFLNPDVVPTAADWAARHLQVLDSAPAHTTRIFGAPLFYADGSLMHAGLYFEMDWGISISGGSVRKLPMLRVEHYGKGAPPDLAELRRSRQVPAISGAFISIDRRLFERLEGFSEDYVFGHYEDADLCLRAYMRGIGSWIHDIPLWHLEGKGSVRLPFHEGASLVNRWQCTRIWHERLMADGLVGRAPALRPCAAPAAEAPKKRSGAPRPATRRKWGGRDAPRP